MLVVLNVITGEAVFFSLTTTDGMSLFFQCVSCAHKGRIRGGPLWKKAKGESD